MTNISSISPGGLRIGREVRTEGNKASGVVRNGKGLALALHPLRYSAFKACITASGMLGLPLLRQVATKVASA